MVSIASARSVPNLRQPQAAVGDDGAIFVTFGADNAIYCSTSTDGDESYSDPVRVGTVNRLALGMRRGPRIAVSGDAVVIAAVSHEDGTVLSWRSTDQGRTWNGPTPISDASPGSANEGLHALAAASDGRLYCVWLDHRLDRKNQIFGAASADGGKTWSENRLIYKSPSGNVCECCHPAVTFDRSGKLHVMWRNSLNGFRDMYVASSSDGGKTFGEASKLGLGSWKLDACPMDGGYFAAHQGKLTTVWRRELQIFRAESSGEEQLLAIGEQPWIAATPEGAWIVWLSKRGGDLWLAPPGGERPIRFASGATDPAVAAAADGEGPVVAVWETGRGRDTTIMARVAGD
ncbi:MAG TPA: sialidase family protein [Pirellulaceae bacterium]|nr:sialidase family protein [Pirellulaceae bacterium]